MHDFARGQNVPLNKTILESDQLYLQVWSLSGTIEASEALGGLEGPSNVKAVMPAHACLKWLWAFTWLIRLPASIVSCFFRLQESVRGRNIRVIFQRWYWNNE